MKSISVGLPKALFYFEHCELWSEFFRQLGVDVVVSDSTNKSILDKGMSISNSEYCLPLKVFMGHVESIADKVDYIFIPRYNSIDKNEFACPKFCALPDLVKLDLNREVKILEAEINLHKHPEKLLETLVKISRELKLSTFTTIMAFKNSLEKIKSEEKNLAQDKESECIDTNQIAILGHSYILGDGFINMRLNEKVKKAGFETVLPNNLNINKNDLRRYAEPYSKEGFWSAGVENLGTAFYLAGKRKIKGAIYITPFACGIDSIVAEIIEMRYSNMYNIPFLKLTIDEQTGEAGFNTRLEAFFDVLEKVKTEERKGEKYETNIS